MIWNLECLLGACLLVCSGELVYCSEIIKCNVSRELTTYSEDKATTIAKFF